MDEHLSRREFRSRREAAKILQMDETTLGKWVSKVGLSFTDTRGRGNQKIKGLSLSEIEMVKEAYSAGKWEELEEISESVDSIDGVFYVLVPHPQIPNQVKVGFTKSIDQRLATYKTLCPLAEVKKVWPIKKIDEKTIIRQATPKEKQLGLEVFEVRSLGEFIKRIDKIMLLFEE